MRFCSKTGFRNRIAVLCKQVTGLDGKLWVEYFSGTPAEQMLFRTVRVVLDMGSSVKSQS